MNIPSDTLLSLAPSSLASTDERIRPAQEQNPSGFPRQPLAGGVSLSYAECPGCGRNFATDAIGLIPAHRQGRNPFPRAGQSTAAVCRGSRLILLE